MSSGLRAMLTWGALAALLISEVTTFLLALAAWGVAGIAVILLGPLAPVVVTLQTHASGPLFWLVVAVLLAWLATRGQDD